jgi:hemoglobin
MKRSLYEKIGGFSTVSGIVLSFYDKVLESEDIAPYFASVDMPRLIDHQTQFVCALLGGPASFSDEHIAHAHRKLRISPAAFDHAAALFREALIEAGLAEEDIAPIGQLFESKRPFVVEG